MLKVGNCITIAGNCILIAVNQGWGQVQYLYLSTYLSVLEYLVYGNAKVLVLVLDQKYLVLTSNFQVLFIKKCKNS